MAGQKPYEPNDPPQQPRFKLPKETDAMPDAPTSKSQHPTHEQLRQQQAQAQRPNQTSTPQPNPQQPSQASQGGNIQNILAYFASQGVQDDHVVATIGGFPLKLSELKATSGQHNPPPPQDTKQDERKRPSKGEENDS